MATEQQKTYRLETIFIGHEGESESKINGQPEYSTVYTANAEIIEQHGEKYVQFSSRVQGMYLSDEKGWADTEEEQDDLRPMMEKAILDGEAVAV